MTRSCVTLGKTRLGYLRELEDRRQAIQVHFRTRQPTDELAGDINATLSKTEPRRPLPAL